LTGGAAVNGIGNAMSNILTGNSAANSLSAGDGADTLYGGWAMTAWSVAQEMTFFMGALGRTA
jgi:Ca2+-binding RTX toxin-like protein